MRISNQSLFHPITFSVKMNIFRRGAKNFLRVPKRGIEEFIDKTLFDGVQMEKAGRRWRIGELRHKSYSDLHKIWFVLLKERNLLLTMKNLAQTMERRPPRPSRLKKVKKSMASIKEIVKERNIQAMKLAWKEFELNKKQGKYTYPIQNNEVAQTENTSETK